MRSAYVGDNLTITKAPLTVTANPQTKVYGQQDPVIYLYCTNIY